MDLLGLLVPRGLRGTLGRVASLDQMVNQDQQDKLDLEGLGETQDLQDQMVSLGQQVSQVQPVSQDQMETLVSQDQQDPEVKLVRQVAVDHLVLQVRQDKQDSLVQQDR